MNKSIGENKTDCIVYSGLTLILMSAAWIIFQNGGMIEISADHDLTVPFWHNWIISGGMILLIILLPERSLKENPFNTLNRKWVGRQAAILIALAVVFTVTLTALPSQLAITYFPLFKILFLVIGPLLMFNYFKVRHRKAGTDGHSYFENNPWFFPLVVTIIWVYFYFISPFGPPVSSEYQMGFIILATGALFSFLLNSVLEELFYRVWLQTRLEALLGTWPAIMLSSLLWAVWHMAIQGGDSLDIAFSNVVVNQGVIGLFLGFLWTKYRNVWVLIIIHGLMNFPMQLITGYF